MPKESPPEPFKPGQILRAKDLNWFRNTITRLENLTGQPPVFINDGVVRVSVRKPMAIKLTGGGTGGKYAWTLQVASTGGMWTDHPSGLTGTTSSDPAYEINLDASVSLSPNPVVDAWRDQTTNTVFFSTQSC